MSRMRDVLRAPSIVTATFSDLILILQETSHNKLILHLNLRPKQPSLPTTMKLSAVASVISS